MSRSVRKGTAFWALAFLSLLAVLNVFNAILRVTLQGSSSTLELSLFGIVLGNITVELYFWISIALTSMLFSVTALIIYRGFPADPEVLERLAKLEANLTLNANMLENTQMGFFRRLEETEKATDDAVHRISLSLEEAMKNTQAALEKERKELQTVAKQSRERAVAVNKFVEELTDIRRKVEGIGEELTPAKPKLTSQSRITSLKAVPSSLARELKRMGITNIGEFLTADPAIIAQKSGELTETITNLQAMAQLMMVPGVDEENAELLVRVGVTSRRELANQDSVQLYRVAVSIARAQVVQGKMSERQVPTLEDVSSWIRLAEP